MKIRKLEFTNHPVLGNLRLDFTDQNGNVVDTIILAGENGTGKSLLFNLVYYFSIPKTVSQREKSDYQSYFEIEFSDSEIEVIKLNQVYYERIKRPLKNNIFMFHLDYSLVDNWGWTKIFVTADDEQKYELPGQLFVNEETRKVLKTIFSDVEINFTPNEISNVTAKDIDEKNNKSQRSNNSIATDITQLLIDIQSTDALELGEWVRNNANQVVPTDKVDVRMKRFSKAFEYMFPTKRYKRIDTSNGKKDVIFEEHEKEMEIRYLSSGEKQIVFRGGFLLKNKESAKGALILIDEPEISLHPKWQLKVLTFFKQLFSKDGEQTSQLIIATHSPFILHNSNRNNDKVIVLQKDENGKIKVQADPSFYSWSNEKKIEAAFDVSNVVKPKITTVFLEGETDERYFNKAAELFGIDLRQISFDWIGRINENGQAENTGDSALNHARTYFLANPDMINGKVVLLFDNDTNKPEETVVNLLVRKMASDQNNSIYKIGIESLLHLPSDFDASLFYKEKEKIDDYGATTTSQSLSKTTLCDYICLGLPEEAQKNMLKGIFEEIKKLI